MPVKGERCNAAIPLQTYPIGSATASTTQNSHLHLCGEDLPRHRISVYLPPECLHHVGAMKRSCAVAIACGMLLLAAAPLALAAPLKTPTARRGPCWDETLGELQAADKRPAGKGYGLVFYGDSIFESLRGTDKCRSCVSISTRSSCAGVPAVLTKYFGKYSPGVMSMSMDQSANLMWRLQNGQIPKTNKPRVVVINIGTNDFTNCGWSINDQAKKEAALTRELKGIQGRIQAAVALLQKSLPTSKVVILGLLPRGTESGKGIKLDKLDMRWPSHYAKATAKLNSDLRSWAAKQARVSFVDCGSVFISRGSIVTRLMTDAVHPTKDGWEALAKCLEPAVAKAW